MVNLWTVHSRYKAVLFLNWHELATKKAANRKCHFYSTVRTLTDCSKTFRKICLRSKQITISDVFNVDWFAVCVCECPNSFTMSYAAQFACSFILSSHFYFTSTLRFCFKTFKCVSVTDSWDMAWRGCGVIKTETIPNHV